MCILSPGEETVPAMMMVLAVRSQVSPDVLNLVLSLAFGLGEVIL